MWRENARALWKFHEEDFAGLGYMDWLQCLCAPWLKFKVIKCAFDVMN